MSLGPACSLGCLCRCDTCQGCALLGDLLEQPRADQACSAAQELPRQPLGDCCCQLCGRHRRGRYGRCGDNASGCGQDADTGVLGLLPSAFLLRRVSITLWESCLFTRACSIHGACYLHDDAPHEDGYVVSCMLAGVVTQVICLTRCGSY